jgi:hypothetical protein
MSAQLSRGGFGPTSDGLDFPIAPPRRPVIRPSKALFQHLTGALRGGRICWNMGRFN